MKMNAFRSGAAEVSSMAYGVTLKIVPQPWLQPPPPDAVVP
jgi:hypothetical protein